MTWGFWGGFFLFFFFPNFPHRNGCTYKNVMPIWILVCFLLKPRHWPLTPLYLYICQVIRIRETRMDIFVHVILKIEKKIVAFYDNCHPVLCLSEVLSDWHRRISRDKAWNRLVCIICSFSKTNSVWKLFSFRFRVCEPVDTLYSTRATCCLTSCIVL